MNIPDVLKEGLAWIGFAAIVWQAAKCIGSYTDHPSSHDIRRKPWTDDERDVQRRHQRMMGRKP